MNPSPKPLCILVLSGDMEKGLAAMNLSLAAAAGGAPVTLFFSFWGLNFLKRPGAKARGAILQRMMGWMNGDSATSQRLGRFHLGGVGRWAMGRLMRAKQMPSFLNSLALAKPLGVRVVACSTSLEVMGLTREELIPEVDAVEGAAAFLQVAGEANIVTLS